MNIKSIFSKSLSAFCNFGVTNKKKVLEKISKMISAEVPGVKSHHIFDALQQREKIGSTAFGHGVAIPHARIHELTEPHCVVLCLKQAINFSGEHESEKNVDLIFGLVVPENYDEEHLCILSQLGEKLLKPEFRQRLRKVQDSQEIYSILVDDNA